MSEFVRLTTRSPKNNMAYLVNVKDNEQDLEGSYNTLVCVKDAIERLAAYEDIGVLPGEIQMQIDTLSDTINMLSPYVIGRPEAEIVSELKMHYKAVEMLKEFAFVDFDESKVDRCSSAGAVQKLLRDLGHGKWVDDQIIENRKNKEYL